MDQRWRFVAIAFGIAMFLWLHLKWTRMTLSRLRRERIVIQTQLSLAADIQRELLPPVPSDTEGIRWAAQLEQAGRNVRQRPARFFVRPDARSWLVLVGDVSGKGVPAALVLASIRTIRMMTSATSDPAELAESASRDGCKKTTAAPYLTCVIVKIDLDTHELAYINAGHPSGLIPRLRPWPASAVPRKLRATGWSVRPIRNTSESLSLVRGATSILVTDGITEAFDVLGLSETNPIASLVRQAPRPLSPRLSAMH